MEKQWFLARRAPSASLLPRGLACLVAAISISACVTVPEARLDALLSEGNRNEVGATYKNQDQYFDVPGYVVDIAYFTSKEQRVRSSGVSAPLPLGVQMHASESRIDTVVDRRPFIRLANVPGDNDNLFCFLRENCIDTVVGAEVGEKVVVRGRFDEYVRSPSGNFNLVMRDCCVRKVLGR